ncbi:dehydrogenase/reductase SDR family member 12 isoform X2 [Momordica charantia]|uniref:Dehydrogenase/reductase SDR family member 12 isoform X2 n=1 Tax=Momordica charantia TaxID=3673 RepID=A0A6J1CPV2_MOMCH|nr:dehydrogenase/reductase SDR family member 12 isoform X2 [Momordica charantia]
MERGALHIRVNISIGALAMFLLKAWRATAFGVYGFLHFTKSGFIEHSKKFKPEDMQTSIEGKNCIVTGANSGIGYATAEGLASRGATVYMVCRNKERGEAALSEIKSKTGNQNIHLEVCDLSSVSEIKSFASNLTSKDVPVHILINNAGLLEHNRIMTPEGFELNFAVNVLGTYAMTESMMPLLEKAAPDAKVITVSSGGMYSVPLTNDLQFSDDKFDGVKQYSLNKRVQYEMLHRDESETNILCQKPNKARHFLSFHFSGGFDREMGRDVL